MSSVESRPPWSSSLSTLTAQSQTTLPLICCDGCMPLLQLPSPPSPLTSLPSQTPPPRAFMSARFPTIRRIPHCRSRRPPSPHPWQSQPLPMSTSDLLDRLYQQHNATPTRSVRLAGLEIFSSTYYLSPSELPHPLTLPLLWLRLSTPTAAQIYCKNITRGNAYTVGYHLVIIAPSGSIIRVSFESNARIKTTPFSWLRNLLTVGTSKCFPGPNTRRLHHLPEAVAVIQYV
jgi:hypothetical protein